MLTASTAVEQVHTAPTRRRWIVPAGLVAALITGAVLGWAASEDGNVVRVVRGTVENVSGDGEGIALDNEAYMIGTVLDWQGFDGSWREGGRPECLVPWTSGAVVELGVMAVPDRHDAGGRPNHVVWVKCVSPPTTG